MIPRIKEVFARFDTSGDGSLDMYELRKVLKTLVGKLSYRELDQYCKDVDKSGDGQVSLKEFVEWVLKGSASELIIQSIKAETGEKRSQRIKDTFDRYDASGDGSLDISELQTVLKQLGAFTNAEVVTVCKDLDKSNDGQVDFDEFEAWLKHGGGGKVVTKAKAILAPADNDGLESVFYCYCTAGRCDMDSKTFVKMCKDASLVDKQLTTTVLDLIFNHTSVKAKGDKFIDFCQFEVALEVMAERRGADKDAVREKMLNLTSPVLKGTKADYVRFHDDKSTYTGAHKIDTCPLPGGGPVPPQSPMLKSASSTLSRSPPQSPLSKSGSRGGLRSGGSTRLKSTSCTSLDDPVVDNRELYKVFGLNTKAGRAIRSLYAKEEEFSPGRSLNSSPANRATRNPGSDRRAVSLPAIARVGHGDNLMLSSPHGPKLWKSPFLRYLKERGPPSSHGEKLEVMEDKPLIALF